MLNVLEEHPYLSGQFLDFIGAMPADYTLENIKEASEIARNLPDKEGLRPDKQPSRLFLSNLREHSDKIPADVLSAVRDAFVQLQKEDPKEAYGLIEFINSDLEAFSKKYGKLCQDSTAKKDAVIAAYSAARGNMVGSEYRSKTLPLNLSDEQLKALGPLGEPAASNPKVLRALADSLGCNLELSSEGLEACENAIVLRAGGRWTIRIRPDAPMIAALGCFQHEADHTLRVLLNTMLEPGEDPNRREEREEKIARFVDALGTLSLIKAAGRIERDDKELADAIRSYIEAEIAEFNKYFGSEIERAHV